MSVLSLDLFLREQREELKQQLPRYLSTMKAPEVLVQSMLYSLEAGGKRLRPALLLATLQGYGIRLEKGYDVACAVEMIHTYSLIHDDLPAMDDDDTRRGKPTNHKIFGEAMAILAGDALLTYSFEIISRSKNLNDQEKVRVIQLLASASGPTGMVGGQVADMEGENKVDLTVGELEYIHQHKTGDLLAFSIEAAAVLANAPEKDQIHLRHFAKHLGLAFQIKDDILDIEGDGDKMGKPIGSDEENQKSTYPKLLGLDGAKEKLVYHIQSAKDHLSKVNQKHVLLEELTDYIASRTY
ncbi:polyprenyl synthetase family protein [Alteribacter aurantiacus]|uniref:polyprenyl synthetase family protein n=1 Tax=Alteribacter aurantiacus TaxID=254410 RepID=UPI00040DCF45|nr:farnesyl diphosphate synthase [Alteribacter aurantiacus]